ncbi:universal stress protein [Roseovarius aestuariivivens]|uniref:universal stress protein n=1 Tax=Roseovarius aestuariivivens TaxID=1888910 RepID=UPI0010812EB2|nr:universal stress protein [Roseovarius aestuariivivens]
MYKKILVGMALDHGLSPQTLRIAEALLDPGGEIIALHVYESPQGSASAYLDDDVVKAAYKKAEATLTEKLKATPHVTPKMIRGHTARSIIDFAAEAGVDCIVIGSHKPGMRDFFIGSTASRVVRHAHCAVHVWRDEG